jgi:hypothetical protein
MSRCNCGSERYLRWDDSCEKCRDFDLLVIVTDSAPIIHENEAAEHTPLRIKLTPKQRARIRNALKGREERVSSIMLDPCDDGGE